ncbi:DUF6884 domain-containing protein [Capnocytophaga sp. oral taxon 336]|uniref:DUF6884 domain-containing protein n=1 Tax=Capnocytophaga sp. oral taxon 336 TaxID=712216 RepID=UPI0003A4F996|nr:DUF6884 domain-containing protein [Capnocytophaga sp. oral taxon 336]
MRTIVLISCASQKEDSKMEAEKIYKSTLFKKSLAYAKKLKPDAIYILSALHHLLPLDRVTAPYNLTLNTMSKKERTEWGKKVVEQLKQVANLEKDTFVVLAGENYLTPIQSHLKHLELPLKGMKIGERLQFLTNKTA